MTELRRTAASLIEAARAAGAAGAEVLITETDRVAFSGRREPILNPVSSGRVAVRVTLADGRAGAATVPLAAASERQGPLAAALAAASAAEPDPLEGPADRMDLPAIGLQIADARQPRLEEGDRRDVLAGCEDALRSARAFSGQFTYTEACIRRVFASSRGTEGLESSTRFVVTGVVRGPPGETRGTVESHRFADVASMPLGADLLRRAQLLGTALAWPEGRLPVVLEPRLLGELLPRIAAAFDADRVARGESFIPAAQAQVGAPPMAIASSRLHLVDDASMSGALETRAFDDRGVAPMPLPLIREGELGALYLSPQAARRRGGRPTGHSRVDNGLWSGNLIVRAGARSRNMMFPDVGRYLLVDEWLGWDGLDLRTGALRLKVRLMLGEGGNPLGTLGEAVLTGTVLSLLNGVVELASDQERHGAVDGCTWVVEGLGVER